METSDIETSFRVQAERNPSPLLRLPLEIRRGIFELVLADSTSTSFPPQLCYTPSRILGLVGSGHLSSGGHAASRRKPTYATAMSALLLCRQLHAEARLLPFQVNEVNCVAALGSNTSATKHLVDRLQPFQRRAVRRLRLRLLASVTEAWALRSILRSLAGVGDDTDVEDEDRHQQDTHLDVKSDLRSLTLHISSRDLMLPHADSLAGLRHTLNVIPPSLNAASPCAAPWVGDGLVHLSSLPRLDITVEMSAAVEQHITAWERIQFVHGLETTLPWIADIRVEWEAPKAVNPSVEHDNWLDFFWVTDGLSGTVGESAGTVAFS